VALVDGPDLQQQIDAGVLSGTVRSQVDEEPAKVYTAGESSFEVSAARHKISENSSTTEPAQLLALFVVDTDERALPLPTRIEVGEAISPGR